MSDIQVGMVGNAEGKLVVREIVAKFPKLPKNEGILEDMVCPECGWRKSFRIESKTVVMMTDLGHEEDNHGADLNYEHDSHCQCGSPPVHVGNTAGVVCIKDGTVADFTCPGLDEYLAHKAGRLIEYCELEVQLRRALETDKEFRQYDDGPHRGNGDRAGRARRILKMFSDRGEVDSETWRDLFTDLLHLAHRDKVDLTEAFLAAINHWTEEIQ